MEDESAPLLKGRITPLFGVNKWRSSNRTTGDHATVNKFPTTIDEIVSNTADLTADKTTDYLPIKHQTEDKRADHPTTGAYFAAAGFRIWALNLRPADFTVILQLFRGCPLSEILGPQNLSFIDRSRDFQTFVHLVKGNIGTGLLALPFAISKVGYILGPVLLVTLAIMAVHSMILLVKCCQALCQQLNRTTLDYGEVVEETFRLLKFRVSIVKIAKGTINVFLIATQFGFCCVFFVFFGDNLKQVFDACGLELSIRMWIVIMLPIVTVFTWIRNLDTLAPLSFVGNVGLTFGLGSILYYIIEKMAERDAAVFDDTKVQAAILSMSGLPLFFGNALFTYEAIGMILPIENKMKKPHHFNMVMYAAMTVVTSIYVVIATMGYLTFGTYIRESITLNLPADKHPHSIIFHITKLLFCYSVFISFMLCFYVPMDFLELPIMKRLNIDKSKPIKKSIFHIIFRTTMTTIVAGFAVSIPKLDLFISLIGAFASSLLAIIFPPILEIMVFYKEPEPCWQKMLWIIKSLFILLVGLLGFTTGTYTSVKAIILYFEDST